MQAHYGEILAGLVLFGFHARGDAVPGSDIDVLVVLYQAQQPADTMFSVYAKDTPVLALPATKNALCSATTSQPYHRKQQGGLAQKPSRAKPE